MEKDEKLFQLAERNQLFGHTSRVFVTKVIQFRKEDFFLSAGEDSNICVWSSSGKLLSKKNVCSSGIIWNLDYCPDTETVVTSSSVGKLDSFKLSEILFEKHRCIELEGGCDPVKLRFLSNGILVVLDSKMNIHMRVNDEFVKIIYPQNHRKFVAIEVFEERIFLAAKNSVIVFDYCNEKKLLDFSCDIEVNDLIEIGYLRSLHAINKNEILICDLTGICCVIDIKLNAIEHVFQIPKSSEPWTTSVEKVGDFWLIGDRVGNLFLFDGRETSEKAIEPVQNLWKLHGQLGVTVIKSEGNGIIKTCGNDGTKKTLFLDTSKSPPTIEIFRSERTSINWIEKLRVYNGLEYLLGFNDNYFVVHNNKQIVNEFNCGGRHRHWDLFVVNSEKVIFVYIQKRKLNFVEFHLHNSNLNSINSPSWHTKECNAVEMVDDLMISGGEDTILRISRIKEVKNEMKLEEIASVCSHISSIKCIKTAKVDGDLLVFSAGGRGQINVTRVIKSQVKEELNFLLLKPQNNSDADFNPETRFTDLFFDEASRNLFTVSSDGFIRIFEYKEKNFKIILEHFYGKCLMKVHVIGDLILTMATDGFVVFWVRNESSISLQLVKTIKHNQSGINCFDVFKHSENFYSIATCGDDMNVIITDFEIDGPEVTEISTVANHQLHIAQVTGIKFLEPNVLCTTSIDQTICKLRVENKKILLIERNFTCIPDVKGFFFFDKRFVGVFGAGLEFVPAFL